MARACYYLLPLNAFERMQLINIMLMPEWAYCTLFLSNDSMFSTIDKMCVEFILIAEGMERNSDDVVMSHDILQVPAPVSKCSGARFSDTSAAYNAC